MRAFVTGSTGLLGNNLVRELLGRGWQVRALARSREKAERLLAGTRAEVVIGDLADLAGFAAALEGCDVLFHTAAYFREYYGPGDHAAALERINVQGTLDLVREAHRRGVRRVVDTSTCGIVGLKPDGSPGDESTPPSPIAHSNLYFRSKLRAAERLEALGRETGLEIVSILPGWMFGPYDAAPTASGRLVLGHLAAKLPPAVPPGGMSAVDARDVAAAMASAAARGRPGERYLVGGRMLELAGLLRMLESLVGVPAPTRRLPYAVALAVASVMELGARVTGKPSPLTRAAVRMMAARLQVSSEKAARELGVTFRPMEETLRDEVAWYREHGLAPARAPAAPASGAAAAARVR